MGGCCGTQGRPATELPDVAPGYGKKSTLVHQQKTWEATGVVSLRDSKLKVRAAPEAQYAHRELATRSTDVATAVVCLCRTFPKDWTSCLTKSALLMSQTTCLMRCQPPSPL